MRFVCYLLLVSAFLKLADAGATQMLWKQVQPEIPENDGHSAVVYGDLMVTFGGRTTPDGTGVAVYSLTTRQWCSRRRPGATCIVLSLCTHAGWHQHYARLGRQVLCWQPKPDIFLHAV